MVPPRRERCYSSLQIFQLGLILSTSTSVSAFGTRPSSLQSFRQHRHTNDASRPIQSEFQRSHTFKSRPALHRIDETTETQSRTSSHLKPSERNRTVNGNSNNVSFDGERKSNLDPQATESKQPKSPKPSPQRRKSKNIRMELFSFLSSSRVEVVSALTVFLTTFLVALNTLQNLPTVPLPNGSQLDIHQGIGNSLAAINLLFAFDFFLRWYAAGNFKLRYLKTPLVLLDVLVILLPLWLSVIVPMLDAMVAFPISGATTTAIESTGPTFDFEGLQNLMLLRVLRLNRVLTDTNTFERFEVALGIKSRDVRPYQLQLARVILSIFTLLSVASGLIYTAEHKVNPQIPDYFAALYFGLTTLTTVGFGDITPVTAEGRLIVGLSIFAGVTIIPAQAATLVDAILQFQDERPSRRGLRISSSRSTTRNSSTNEINGNTLPQSSIESTLPTNTFTGVNGNSLTTAATLGQSNSDMPTSSEPSMTTDSSTLMDTSVTSIETSTIEKASADDVEDDDSSEWIGWMGLCCLECGESDHREDASFCWHCGSEL